MIDFTRLVGTGAETGTRLISGVEPPITFSTHVAKIQLHELSWLRNLGQDPIRTLCQSVADMVVDFVDTFSLASSRLILTKSPPE